MALTACCRRHKSFHRRSPARASNLIGNGFRLLKIGRPHMLTHPILYMRLKVCKLVVLNHTRVTLSGG